MDFFNRGWLLWCWLHWLSAAKATSSNRLAPEVAILKRLLFHCQLPLSVFSHLYQVLLRPCLEYVSPVWDNCSSSDSNSLSTIPAYSFLLPVSSTGAFRLADTCLATSTIQASSPLASRAARCMVLIFSVISFSLFSLAVLMVSGIDICVRLRCPSVPVLLTRLPFCLLVLLLGTSCHASVTSCSLLFSFCFFNWFAFCFRQKFLLVFPVDCQTIITFFSFSCLIYARFYFFCSPFLILFYSCSCFIYLIIKIPH